jgi:adsorption protein B
MIAWGAAWLGHRPWPAAALAGPALRGVGAVLLAVSLFGAGLRMACCARIYGWKFAAGAPLRMLWANWINCVATLDALWEYAAACLAREAPDWCKTDHVYPIGQELAPQKPRLGELLLHMRALQREELERALASQPAGVRLGDHLVAQGLVPPEPVLEALGRQQGIAFGLPEAVSRAAARAVPAKLCRRWRVLPFQVTGGRLWVATPALPSESLLRELREASSLTPRFRLVPNVEFEPLLSEHLPR